MSTEHCDLVKLELSSRHLLADALKPGCDSLAVGPISPLTLSIEGNEHARRLVLAFECYLYPTQRAAVRLKGRLISQSWAPLLPLPPVGRAVPDLKPELDGSHPEVELAFTLDLTPSSPTAVETYQWMKFLQPLHRDDDIEQASPALPPPEALTTALQHWLHRRFGLSTLSQAIDIARQGAFGQFGAVEPVVLPRSEQPDLQLDATLLGRTDNSHEVEGAHLPVVSLALYGERYGRWVLHRRTLHPLKAIPKNIALSRIRDEVIVTDSSDSLLQQVGLDDTAKRLFQLCGLLPHTTLWYDDPAMQTEMSDEPAEGASAPVPAPNLSALPDKARRQLQAILSLAQTGTLDSSDIEILWRNARHLGRRKR